MSTYKRDDILRDLKQCVMEVTFEKVNGQKRIMRCTLDPRYMPATLSKEQSKQIGRAHV